MNLLLNPNNWTDGTHSPPSCWNGSSYVTSAPQGDYIEVFLTFIGSYTGSDTIAFDYSNATTASPTSGGQSTVYVQFTPGSRESVNPIGNSSSSVSYAVPTGLTELQVQLGPGSFGEAEGTNTLTVTPTAPPTPVAADGSLVVSYGSENNVAPTEITFDGSPVTPTSLSVASQATNGLAESIGLSIWYTPNPGYTGPDSFTYTGTYESQVSSPGTISVFVQAMPEPPTVVLRWSDDGGHNWSNAQFAPMGELGSTAQRVMWRRIGSTRRNTGLDRIFEISSDSETQVALVGASIGDG